MRFLPRVLPWARSFCPFRACGANLRLPFQALGVLETEADFCICHGVIVLSQRLVVDQRILGEDADSLADVEVQTCLILRLLHVALAVRLIHVVTRLDIDSAVLWQLCQWGDH